MMKKQSVDMKLSKLMTKMLRHKPLESGLQLDEEDGSCSVEELLRVIKALPGWSEIKLSDMERVVRNSDKQRFEIKDGRIKARYGHSYQKIQYTPGNPPAVLYHGTSKQALPFIMAEGIPFYYAGNEVWLAEWVPWECCSLAEEDEGPEER
jgi:putative RNA 2'-phosphotransferase